VATSEIALDAILLIGVFNPINLLYYIASIWGYPFKRVTPLFPEHCDPVDLPFMELFLLMMKEAGPVNLYDLARLTDRIQIYKGNKQIYGTGLILEAGSDVLKFRPIKDIKNIDKRRKEMGLNTLSEYAQEYEKDGQKVELPKDYQKFLCMS
jgi:hypothetical protein